MMEFGFQQRANGLAIALTFIWCGLLIGISFMEAPLKFQAPGVTTEIGVGIGKLVFSALNRVEWLLASAVLISFLKCRVELRVWLVFAVPLVMLVAQSFFLLPRLHERVELIQTGMAPPPSKLHHVFIVAEVVKLIALVIVGSALLKTQSNINE